MAPSPEAMEIRAIFERGTTFFDWLLGEYDFANGLWNTPAAPQEESTILLIIFIPPVNIAELCQGALNRRVVKTQRDEPVVLVQRVAKPEGAGLQLRPVRAERMGRHTEH